MAHPKVAPQFQFTCHLCQSYCIEGNASHPDVHVHHDYNITRYLRYCPSQGSHWQLPNALLKQPIQDVFPFLISHLPEYIRVATAIARLISIRYVICHPRIPAISNWLEHFRFPRFVKKKAATKARPASLVRFDNVAPTGRASPDPPPPPLCYRTP